MGILTTHFPDDIARGAEGGWPGWLVTIVPHAGGVETPTLDDPHPRGRWNVARAVEKLAKHEVARRHFIKARSSYHYFGFRDHSDDTCARTGIDRGRLVGSGTTWQVSKAYGTDEPSFEYVRALGMLMAGTLQVWRDNVLQVAGGGSDYTVDLVTGAITSAVSWDSATTLECACRFRVLCRYDIDRLSARVLARSPAGELKLSWPDIDIVQVFPQEVEA
jgi:uncharacterized protein (TIGR02217 family)